MYTCLLYCFILYHFTLRRDIVRITSYCRHLWTKLYAYGTYLDENASVAFSILTLLRQSPFIPRYLTCCVFSILFINFADVLLRQRSVLLQSLFDDSVWTIPRIPKLLEVNLEIFTSQEWKECWLTEEQFWQKYGVKIWRYD